MLAYVSGQILIFQYNNAVPTCGLFLEQNKWYITSNYMAACQFFYVVSFFVRVDLYVLLYGGAILPAAREFQEFP